MELETYADNRCMKHSTILLLPLLLAACGKPSASGRYVGSESGTTHTSVDTPFSSTIDVTLTQGDSDQVTGTFTTGLGSKGTITGKFNAETGVIPAAAVTLESPCQGTWAADIKLEGDKLLSEFSGPPGSGGYCPSMTVSIVAERTE